MKKQLNDDMTYKINYVYSPARLKHYILDLVSTLKEQGLEEDNTVFKSIFLDRNNKTWSRSVNASYGTVKLIESVVDGIPHSKLEYTGEQQKWTLQWDASTKEPVYTYHEFTPQHVIERQSTSMEEVVNRFMEHTVRSALANAKNNIDHYIDASDLAVRVHKFVADVNSKGEFKRIFASGECEHVANMATKNENIEIRWKIEPAKDDSTRKTVTYEVNVAAASGLPLYQLRLEGPSALNDVSSNATMENMHHLFTTTYKDGLKTLIPLEAIHHFVSAYHVLDTIDPEKLVVQTDFSRKLESMEL